MMNADCLRCDRLIRLQWDGAFRRGGFVQPLRLRGTEGRREKKKEESEDGAHTGGRYDALKKNQSYKAESGGEKSPFFPPVRW